MSRLGIGFDFDTEGEESALSPVSRGETVELHFYLNQSLYLPLVLKVARIEGGSVRRVGAEFKDQQTAGYRAFLAFFQMLEAISEVAQVDQTGT